MSVGESTVSNSCQGKYVALSASARKQERQSKSKKPKDSGRKKIMQIEPNISERRKD